MFGIVDFSEINDAHRWEQFAEAFLEKSGFIVTSQPAVGGDFKKDLIAAAPTQIPNANFRWLVSCKNYSKNKTTIGSNDDFPDSVRLRFHHCHGFLGFYSRPVTQDLYDAFEKVASDEKCAFRVYDNATIERQLISDSCFSVLLYQFFPRTYQRLYAELDFSNKECDCGNSIGNVYFLPYQRHGDPRVEFTRICGACHNYTVFDEGFRVGEPIPIYFAPDEYY